jgi:hypothetical protein
VVTVAALAAMKIDGHGLELLDEEACVELLRTSALGRVALTHEALPIILPVAFSFLDRDLIFAVGPGVLARAAENSQIVCFEADWADAGFLNAWNVSVIGPLSTVTDPTEVARAQELPLGPWPTASASFVKLAPGIYSGRRRFARSLDGR